MNAIMKAAGLKALKYLGRILAHVLDFKPADGSVEGSLNAIELLKLIANYVAIHGAAWSFLGPKAGVVAGMAALVVKGIQLLMNQDPKVTEALAQSNQPSGSRFL